MNYKDDMNYKDESLGQLPILWKRFDFLYFFVRIFLNLCTQYPDPGERPLLAPFPALHPTPGPYNGGELLSAFLVSYAVPAWRGRAQRPPPSLLLL